MVFLHKFASEMIISGLWSVDRGDHDEPGEQLNGEVTSVGFRPTAVAPISRIVGRFGSGIARLTRIGWRTWPDATGKMFADAGADKSD